MVFTAGTTTVRGVGTVETIRRIKLVSWDAVVLWWTMNELEPTGSKIVVTKVLSAQDDDNDDDKNDHHTTTIAATSIQTWPFGILLLPERLPIIQDDDDTLNCLILTIPTPWERGRSG